MTTASLRQQHKVYYLQQQERKNLFFYLFFYEIYGCHCCMYGKKNLVLSFQQVLVRHFPFVYLEN